MSSRRPVQEDRRPCSKVAHGKYIVKRKVGEGSFGIIYEGTDTHDAGKGVAIKFEQVKASVPQLKDEYRTYRHLEGTVGIPKAYYFGEEGNYNALVIDLLGPSLEDMFEVCSRRFTVKTVAMLAKKMITRVQSIHEKHLIYRDIKPDNFLIGRPGTKHANTVYMIDFGMAKFFRDPSTRQHIPYRERKSLSGTARYMSINTHLGKEQSRRDDLEALGHVFMYFLRSSLPWQGLRANTNKKKYEQIGNKKQTTLVDDLCDGYPVEFGLYLKYARGLGFDEEPDYDHLRGLFDNVLRNLDEKDDGVYDWMLLNEGKGWEHRASALHRKSYSSQGAVKALQNVNQKHHPSFRPKNGSPRHPKQTAPPFGQYGYPQPQLPTYQYMDTSRYHTHDVESIHKRGFFRSLLTSVTCCTCSSNR